MSDTKSKAGEGTRRRREEGADDVAPSSTGPGSFTPPPLRRAPHSPAPEAASPKEPPTIFDRLRSTNFELLDSLRRLEQLHRQGQEYATDVSLLVDETSAKVAKKRWIEEDFVFPLLLDHASTQQEALMSRAQGQAIGELLGRLRSTDPTDESFPKAVEELLDAVEHQVTREEDRLLPAGERVTPQEWARDLGRRLT